MNSPRISGDCGWVNHVAPIHITRQERDSLLSESTLRSIDNLNQAWKRYCASES